MTAGVIAGLAAGALWGLVFVSSLAVEPFTPYDLTVVRYLIFSLFCIPPAILAVRDGRIVFDRSTIRAAVLLGAVGYTLYFILAAVAVRFAGVSVVALIVGVLPLVLAIAGNLRMRRLAWGALAPPLLLVAAGLAFVNGEAVRKIITGEGISGISTDPGRFALGVALAAAANACWAIYAFENDRALRERPRMRAYDWTLVQGVGAVAGLLPLMAIGPLWGWTRLDLFGWNAETARFLVWAGVLGLVTSAGAAWLWSIASRQLPVAVAGLLIVSETVFGVAFGLIHAGRGPTPGELAGTAFLVAGVAAGLRVFARARPAGAT